MAAYLEIQVWQRDKLYTLLKLREINRENEINGLEEMINAALAVMNEEDVALVEKRIKELYK